MNITIKKYLIVIIDQMNLKNKNQSKKELLFQIIIYAYGY